MASTYAAASSSSTTQTKEVRPQAGPIPSKRGEIGFVEGAHEQVQQPSQMDDQAPLPLRHPADSRVPSLLEGPANEVPPPSGTFPTLSDGSSITDVDKRSFLKRRRLIFMGIQTTTFLLLGVQLVLFTGTVIGWVFAAITLSNKRRPNDPSTGSGPTNNKNAPTAPDETGISNIFVHVAFSVLVLTQLVLIERRIFRVRAERYADKHPGEIPPPSLQRGRSVTSMPVAPWSRPPLPTYAAALMSSGVGTGDVEDVEIAQPPPPAYGKTRGSRLILAGFLRDSLRAQAREYEGDRGSVASRRSDRPISFVSDDSEWEVRRDADRARSIEEALAVLENERIV